MNESWTTEGQTKRYRCFHDPYWIGERPSRATAENPITRAVHVRKDKGTIPTPKNCRKG